MRDKKLKEKRNKAIVKRYNQLQAIKTPGGKRKYSYEFIYEKLSEQFFLTEFTIDQIIKNHYKNSNDK